MFIFTGRYIVNELEYVYAIVKYFKCAFACVDALDAHEHI
jgi:hypothetical protein